MLSRLLLVVGCWLALSGAALMLPVFQARLESQPAAKIDSVMIALGVGLLIGGSAAIVVALRRGVDSQFPVGVRIAAAANVIFLAFCALELSDRLVRQEERVFYWTTVLFAPGLLLLAGLLSGRRWAWWTFRGAAALAVLWFLGFAVIIPFANLRTDGVPVPWYGRIYMTAVTLAFAAVFAAAFRSLNGADARGYFRLTPASGAAAPAETS